MTRDETVVLMDAIKTMYPHFYEGSDDMDGVVDLWHDMLRDYSLTMTLQAFKWFTATDTKGFPPVIGQIIQGINEIASPRTDELSEGEVWGLVKKALCNGYYHSRQEFDKLPPLVQRAVGNAEMIYRWSMMDEEMVDNSIRGMVCRSYKALAEAQREKLALPPSLSARMEALKAPDAAKPALTAPVYETPDDPAGEEQQPAKPQGFSGPGFERFMAGVKALAAQMAIDEAERGRIEIADPDAEARAWTEERAREMMNG